MKSDRIKIVFNVLTRTAHRPMGFKTCHESISQQKYQNVRHIVSYENKADLNYLNEYNLNKIKVEGKERIPENIDGFIHAPYNLYCNILLNEVEDGWIIFLDDDDNFLHNKVLQEIEAEIQKANADTLFIWQMRYPNGKVVPEKQFFKSKKLELGHIGSPCIAFHSKYKHQIKWDEWKCADYRFIKSLYEIIPHKKWIPKIFIQINNNGDYGRKNDISSNITSNLIFNKNLIWSILPKYHYRIFNILLFHKQNYYTLIKIPKRIFKKLSGMVVQITRKKSDKNH